MIDEFVSIWNKHSNEIRDEFKSDPPGYYDDIVRSVVRMLYQYSSVWRKPDPERIVVVDHGDYQGTLVYVIGESGYQPSKYWYVKTSYGSCSGCDAFRYAKSLGLYSEPPTGEELDAYMRLALHVLQGLKEM